jgi:hypothetical protein
MGFLSTKWEMIRKLYKEDGNVVALVLGTMTVDQGFFPCGIIANFGKVDSGNRMNLGRGVRWEQGKK